MNDILKSEIVIVLLERTEGISLEEFGGLFRQVHGYNFQLSNYGYSSLKKLLNDMKDVVDLTIVNGKDVLRCKPLERHHGEVSNGTNSSQAQEQSFGLSSVPLPSFGSSPGPVVKKHEQAQHTPVQQHPVKQTNSTNSATGKKSKATSKSKCSLLDKNFGPTVGHMNRPQPAKREFSSSKKTARINKTTKMQKVSATLNPPTSNTVHTRSAGKAAIAASSTAYVSKTRRGGPIKPPKSQRNDKSTENVRSFPTRVIVNPAFPAIPESRIRPNVSYASVCANKIQPNPNGQQYTPNNNIKFNVETKVNPTSVTQSYSRAEPKPSIQTSSVVKKNIQVLLNQHAHGLSIFQLQKLYLLMFQQPLKFKGLATVKQFLLELRDVVKTEGVGVQMLVYPVHAKNNPATAANKDSPLQGACSVFINKNFQKEAILKPHNTGFMKTQNYKLQEAAPLALLDEKISISGQQQMDSMEGQLMKILRKPPTPQNMPNVENIPFNADYVPVSDARALPKPKNEKPQHKAPSAQVPHQIQEIHGQEESSYFSKNVIPKENAQNGPSQYSPKVFLLPRLALHSSGFSFLMEQPINTHNKASQMDLADHTSSLTEQKPPYHCNNVLNGPEHFSNANSSMPLKDEKTHQLSIVHVQNTEHLLLQEHSLMNTMQTYGQTEFPALQPRLDLQTANNCNMKKPSYPTGSLETKTALVNIEKPSSIQIPSSQNTKKVENATYSTSQEKATSSQVINNMNPFLNALSNEKTPEAQVKNVVEKTSQQEVSISPCENDLGNANTHDLHDTEEASLMSSNVHKAVDVPTGERKENTSTLPAEEFDEFTTAEGISQSSLLPSKQRQEIVDPAESITKEPEISAALGEPQNHLENSSGQKDMNTWQTNQGHVCCIL
ncbi:uncharacterized protein [Eleutherodactylus coqui]|uniref:uncharacterized protein isoform X1 n=1 Tax=Eleutherodactylus coqui TaxID=57060 RepID=UPI0034631B93